MVGTTPTWVDTSCLLHQAANDAEVRFDPTLFPHGHLGARSGSCGTANDHQHGAFDRLATAAAITLGVPIVAITILDGSHQRCIGAHGFAREDRALFGSFCLEVAIANRPVIVQDARSRNAPSTRTAWGADLVAYAGVPLSSLEGARHGAIGACLPTRRAWQDRDLALLRAFGDAASVVLELELRLARATDALATLEAHVSDLALEAAENVFGHERRRITVELDEDPFDDEERSGRASTKIG